MPKAKIVCTLGPASNNVTVIRKMMQAGMDVVRLNFSHGSYKEQKAALGIVRQLNKKYRRGIKILGDLEGNRIRIGQFINHQPIELKKRQMIWLTQKEALGDSALIPFDYQGELSDIKKGYYIYLDDGNIVLEVKKVEQKRLQCQVVIAGLLKENKGVNIPEAHLKFPDLSHQDKLSLRFSIENKVNYIAQSFVRHKKDILTVKAEISEALPRCLLIAKIECREGIKNIDQIIEVSDGIMIARGDMGISVPIYEIPIIQKEIINKCNRAKKFVITATQMLESMTENLMPTRAEVTDVANAILDGTDYLMLSAETAVGRYPSETVKMMNQIIKFTEQSFVDRNKKQKSGVRSQNKKYRRQELE